MGRWDEGGHVVNFSKTRVGIGLGDEEVPQAALDVRGDVVVRGDVTVDSTTFHVDSSNDRVGVGTTSPLSELDIYNPAGTELIVSRNAGSSANPTIRLWNIDDNNYNNHAAGVSVGTINFSGNERLTGDTHTDDTRAFSYANTLYDWARISALFVGSTSTSTSQGYVRGDLAFHTNNGTQSASDLQERMRIKHDGNVGIGITNPPAKVYVKTTGSASMGGSWNTTDFVVSHGVGYNAPSQSLGVAIGVDGTGDASTSRGYLWCMRPNQTWNTLKIMGNKLELIGLSSVTLNGGASVTSDDRLKTEEEFLQNALPTIMKLKPQKYRKASFLPNDPLKETTENMSEQGDTTFIETGLIVQDIWYDAPELRDLVILGENANPSETKPVDPDPSDPTQDPDYTSWGTTSAVLNYQGVFVVALKAIQELNTDLQVEKAKVADLLARVQALENA